MTNVFLMFLQYEHLLRQSTLLMTADQNIFKRDYTGRAYDYSKLPCYISTLVTAIVVCYRPSPSVYSAFAIWLSHSLNELPRS